MLFQLRSSATQLDLIMLLESGLQSSLRELASNLHDAQLALQQSAQCLLRTRLTIVTAAVMVAIWEAPAPFERMISTRRVLKRCSLFEHAGRLADDATGQKPILELGLTSCCCVVIARSG